METSGKTITIPIKGMVMALICFLIIAGGALGMMQMAAAKQTPEKKKIIQKKLSVSTIPIIAQGVALGVTAYGQAFPVLVTEISPQVSGKIIERHRSLEQGGRVEAGDILFKIDAVDYEIEADKTKIQMELRKNEIAQLKISQKGDQDRLAAIEQNTELSKGKFLRLKTLYQQDRVGTLSAVEDAELSYNSLLDTEKTMKKTLDLYPLQIAEAKTGLSNALSDYKTANLNLERCTIVAPFSGRIKEESIEVGSYITTGTQALTLADDKNFEIQVPLGDKDAFEILGIGSPGENKDRFSDLGSIETQVETVTGNAFSRIKAGVHRAVKYDPDSRTLYLAVRVSQIDMEESIVPLMDGMFCKVYLTGNATREAVKIPMSAMNPDNTIFIARQNRLKTIPVSQVMEAGDEVYISGKFIKRDQIITTKLSNPMENTLLSVSGPAPDTLYQSNTDSLANREKSNE